MGLKRYLGLGIAAVLVVFILVVLVMNFDFGLSEFFENSLTDNLEGVNLQPVDGTVSVVNLQPIDRVYVQQNTTYRTRLQVSCSGGDCGEVEVAVDYGGWPYLPYNGDFETGDETAWNRSANLALIDHPGVEGAFNYSANLLIWKPGGVENRTTILEQLFPKTAVAGYNISWITSPDLNGGDSVQVFVYNADTSSWVLVQGLTDTDGNWVQDSTDLNAFNVFNTSGIRIVGTAAAFQSFGSSLNVDRICFIDSNGECIVASRLVVPDTYAKPFYSMQPNPQYVNLNDGESTIVIFNINATGDLWTNSTFVGRANNSLNIDESNRWRATIVNYTVDNGDPACTMILNTPGENVTLIEDLTFDQTCIIVNASNVVIDGDGFSISGDGDLSDSGILVTQNGDDVEIIDLSVNNFGTGILFQSGSVNSNVINNNLSNNAERGIYLESTTGHRVINNLINSNGQRGIHFYNSSGNTLSGNVLSSNVNNSILLQLNSNNNIIANSSASLSGVLIYQSSGNIFRNISFINSVNDVISLDQASVNNRFENVRVSGTNPSFRDLAILSPNVQDVFFVDTLLGRYQLNSLGNRLIFERTGIGEIRFLSGVNGSGNNLSDDVKIRNNFVEVTKPGLNKSANITLRNLPLFNNPAIFRDGALCPANICFAHGSLSSDPVRFNVTGWSNYSIGEIPISYSLTLSSNLSGAIRWNIQGSGDNQHALGNNGQSGSTTYWADIIAEGTDVDLYVRADGDLVSGGGDRIGLGNESYRFSLIDSAVPGSSETSLATNWTLVDSGLSNGQRIYFKFLLDVASGTKAGTYNNNVEFIIVQEGNSP